MQKFSFIILLFACGLTSCLIHSCRHQNQEPPEAYEIAVAWANLTNTIAKTTPANSPTFASRCFGYTGLTMYESVVNGFPEYQSIASQLNGLGNLPAPEKGITYNWVLSLNAAAAEILRNIYIQTSDENKKRIDSLEQYFLTVFTKQDPAGFSVAESIRFGKKIAQLIFEWSKTDGGHRAYLANFDKSLVFGEKPGSWQPPLYAQSFSHYPLHPHWGKNRTFLAINDSLNSPEPIPFDTAQGSAYYNQFLQVYEKNKNLSQQEKEAAIWWADDPDETVTPPGHSYYLASLAIKKTKPSLIRCAETYARTGMAVADAFRNCWKWKYQFFTERPNTFITAYIDKHWNSFWPDPPFPAFPSGHAIQGAAAATVLTDLYGDRLSFTDSCHAGREKDIQRNTAFVVRHFDSFWEAARETADSRFYGGIHTPMDNEAGLAKGKEIATNINNLNWKKSSGNLR